MKKKIFCFGNEDFTGDEVAKNLAKKITNKSFEFIFSNSTNDILNIEEELIILDVVKGLKQVKLLTQIDDLILENTVSCHDLDLGFYLKLLKEIGKINTVKIIGLPFENFDYNYLQTEVEKILKIL